MEIEISEFLVDSKLTERKGSSGREAVSSVLVDRARAAEQDSFGCCSS